MVTDWLVRKGANLTNSVVSEETVSDCPIQAKINLN